MVAPSANPIAAASSPPTMLPTTLATARRGRRPPTAAASPTRTSSRCSVRRRTRCRLTSCALGDTSPVLAAPARRPRTSEPTTLTVNVPPGQDGVVPRLHGTVGEEAQRCADRGAGQNQDRLIARAPVGRGRVMAAAASSRRVARLVAQTAAARRRGWRRGSATAVQAWPTANRRCRSTAYVENVVKPPSTPVPRNGRSSRRPVQRLVDQDHQHADEPAAQDVDGHRGPWEGAAGDRPLLPGAVAGGRPDRPAGGDRRQQGHLAGPHRRRRARTGSGSWSPCRIAGERLDAVDQARARPGERGVGVDRPDRYAARQPPGGDQLLGQPGRVLQAEAARCRDDDVRGGGARRRPRSSARTARPRRPRTHSTAGELHHLGHPVARARTAGRSTPAPPSAAAARPATRSATASRRARRPATRAWASASRPVADPSVHDGGEHLLEVVRVDGEHLGAAAEVRRGRRRPRRRRPRTPRTGPG